MSTITFQINDKNKLLLDEEFKSQGVSMDEILNQAIEHYLQERQKRFQAARKYVRTRYKKLYQKLA